MNGIIITNKKVVTKFNITNNYKELSNNYKELSNNLDKIILDKNNRFFNKEELKDFIEKAYISLRGGGVLEIEFFNLESYIKNNESIYNGLNKELTILPIDINKLKSLLVENNFFIINEKELDNNCFKLSAIKKSVKNKLIIDLGYISQFTSEGILGTLISEHCINRGIETVINCNKRDFAREDIKYLIKNREDNNENLVLHIGGPWNFSFIESQPKIKNRWMYIFHEFNSLDKSYSIRVNNLFNKVFFVSNFCKDAFKYINIYNKVINHGFDPNIFYKEDKKEYLKEFIFISIAHQQKRKGTKELIESFIEEFKDYEEVRLIIKDINKVNTVANALNTNYYINHPKIDIIQEDYSLTEMGYLLRNSDCFILPTYGEGFGIPILEAKACGKPVITTKYSGQLDFCDNNDTYFIDYDLVKRDDLFVLEEFNSYWARPKISSIKEQMRLVYENKSAAKVKADLGFNNIKNMTWENMLTPLSDEILETLNE